MDNLNSMVILCLIQFTLSEDRISVDTVGTITATAGYSIADNISPSMKSLTSSIEFSGDHDSSKDTSSSSEGFTSSTPGSRNSQSLSLRSRQARGKSPSQPWSSEEKDIGIPSFSLTDHRVNEQLYSVKPQTFDSQSPQLSDIKSNESVEKSAVVPSITYGKKMHKNDGHDDRPVFNDWSEEVHMSFDNNKPMRSRRKNKHQLDSEQEKRKTQNKKLTGDNDENKSGWHELSPNMEMATGIITSVQENDSSQESSGSSELFKAHHHPDLYNSDSISSVEDAGHQAEPQNFNHKQVLSKMNHFDFSNVLSQPNKTPVPREKRLNYLQPGGGGLPAARYPYSGGGPLQQSQVQAVGPSAQPHSAAATNSVAGAKSVKLEQPSATPNYHSIVVPIPISHQMYAAIGGDPSSPVHGHQLASSTVQQAMMSLPVVHNVFFKTDENGGGKTMPAIVIPLKPEYLHQLQQQHYAHMQQQQSAVDDSLNAAGHQRPVHQGAGKALQFQQLHQQQLQQQQQPSASPSSLTPSPYAQKPKTAKVKKPFGLMKDNDLQHRVKQPFGLQHQFYNNPLVGGAGGVGHVQLHHAGHQQHNGGIGGGHQHPQLDAADDSRFAQTATAPAPVPIHAYSGTGHPIVVKRPHAYGYVSPASPASTKYAQAVNKSPPLHHHNHNNHHQLNNNLHHHHQQQQQQQQPSTEELATAIAQQQLMQQQQQQQQQPYKATTYHPGFAYLNGPDDDYPYKPIYKDMNKRNDVLVVRTADGRK